MNYKKGDILFPTNDCVEKSFGLIKKEEKYEIKVIIGKDYVLHDTQNNCFIFTKLELDTLFKKRNPTFSNNDKQDFNYDKELNWNVKDFIMYYKTLLDMYKKNRKILTHMLSIKDVLSISKGNKNARITLTLPLDLADKFESLLEGETYINLSIVNSEDFFSSLLDLQIEKEKSELSLRNDFAKTIRDCF